MLHHLRRLSTQTVIYGMGDAVTRIAGLILLPIYTRILTPADYGRLALLVLVSTIISLILEFGMRSAFFRFYFQHEEVEVRRRLTGTALIFLLGAALIILAPLFLSISYLSLPLFKDAALLPLIQIVLIGTFFDLGSIIPFSIFRAEQRATQYAALSLMRFFINTILNIVAVVVLRWGVEGIIYANLLTSILFFLICLVLTLPSIRWTIDFGLLKRLLVFGLPLVPAYLAGWALTFSDRFFLERYADLSQVGVYAIGYSIASVLNMVMGWFNTAWLPYCYSVAEQPGAKEFYARMLTYALTLFTLVAIGLSLFSPEVLYLLATPSYYGAARVVPLVTLAYLFYEANYLIAFGLDLTGKTSYYGLIVGIAAVLNLLLNFSLIPPFGMMGAAWATALSYMSLMVLAYVIVRRIYPVRYEKVRLLKLSLTSVGLFLAGMSLKTGRLWVDLGVGAAVILSWLAILYFTRFFTERELATARAATHSVLQTLRDPFKRARPKNLVKEDSV
ncbi:MAG TPA: flippase [Pyrinomonadaceae bacterium]|nr:flippase [Pyrinomonadaceae bacterium]